MPCKGRGKATRMPWKRPRLFYRARTARRARRKPLSPSVRVNRFPRICRQSFADAVIGPKGSSARDCRATCECRPSRYENALTIRVRKFGGCRSSALNATPCVGFGGLLSICLIGDRDEGRPRSLLRGVYLEPISAGRKTLRLGSGQALR